MLGLSEPGIIYSLLVLLFMEGVLFLLSEPVLILSYLFLQMHQLQIH